MIWSLKKLRESPLGAQLLKASLGSIVLRLLSMVLSFGVGITMARTLGASGLGVYSYVLSIIAILAIPTELGLPSLIVREVAAARVNEDWGRMRGILVFSSRFVLLFSLVFFAAILAWLLLVDSKDSGEFHTAFLWGAALVPILSHCRLAYGALLGSERVVLGQLPDAILRPAFFVVLLLGWNALAQQDLSAATAMRLQVVATALALATAVVLLMRVLPPAAKAAVSVFDSKNWLKSSLPMALTEGVRVIQGHLAILMLGWFAADADLGIYKVGFQVGGLVALPITTINLVLAPVISRLFTQEDHARLKKAVVLGTLGTTVVSLCIFLFFFLWGEFLIEWVFKAEFLAAYPAVLILGGGQVVSAMLGPTGAILNMTRNERTLTVALAISTLLTLVAGVVLIPRFSIVGAAAASCLGVVSWKAITRYYVKKLIHIECSILGALQLRRDLS